MRQFILILLFAIGQFKTSGQDIFKAIEVKNYLELENKLKAGNPTEIYNDKGLTPVWMAGETDSRRCHINWVVLDSDWEAELCRVVENHPKVKAYVKNQNLGLEVPYRYGSEMRRYIPDFIVRVDDGHGEDDLLNLIVEIKGYRREDAKEKKSTMDTYWIPGVNNNGQHGRWAFAEFRDVYEIEVDFKEKVAKQFAQMIESAVQHYKAEKV
jgi:type III restriction enzyme